MELFHHIGFGCWLVYCSYVINLDLSGVKTALLLLAGLIGSIIIKNTGDRMILNISSKSKGSIVPTYIDGRPYQVRLLTEEESVLFTLEYSERRRCIWFTNYYDLEYWCQDCVQDIDKVIPMRRGFVNQFAFGRYSSAFEDPSYRPVLVPLDPETLKPYTTRLTNQDDSVLKFASLYVNEEALNIPREPTHFFGDCICWCNFPRNAKISIGDSDPDPTKRIKWRNWNGLLVSDRSLINAISWNTLNKNGLVFGNK